MESTRATLAAVGVPPDAWALQAGEEPVRFSDYTEQFRVEAPGRQWQIEVLG